MPVLMFARHSSVRFLVIAFLFSTQSFAQLHTRWQQLPNPTSIDLKKCFFLNSTTGWIAGREGLILKTTNAGTSWNQQQSGIPTDIIDIFMLDEQRGWALSFTNWVDTVTWWGATILQTRNGGDAWTHERFQPEGRYFHTIMFLDTLNGWIGGEFGDLLNTTDGGTTWNPATVDSTEFGQVSIVNIMFFSESTAFATGGLFDIAGVVRRTTNGGLRWVEYGVSPEPVYDLHRIDSLNLIGVSGDFEYGVGVVRSSDAGVHWEYEWLGIFGRPSTLKFRTANEGWVATEIDPKLLFTSNTGATWHEVPSPSGKVIHDLVFVDSATGYAVGDSGTILRYVPAPTAVREQSNNMPSAIVLMQNYPNPFNASTTIRFRLNEESPLKLQIVNPLGQSVKTLIFGERLKAGVHSYQWDGTTQSGAEAASGVYFYQVITPVSVHTKAMALIK